MSELDDESVAPSPRDGSEATTPISAVKAAMLQAVARWIEEFAATNDLANPDLASPEQASQEVRVSQTIRTMFRSLTPEEKHDPAAIAQARASAATLISDELGIEPIRMNATPEEGALAESAPDKDDDDRT